MLSINILCVGKIKEKYLKEALLEYSKRVSKYCNLNIIEVQDEKVPDKLSEKVIENIKDIECEKMCKYIKKDTCLIALDLRGKELLIHYSIGNVLSAFFIAVLNIVFLRIK